MLSLVMVAMVLGQAMVGITYANNGNGNGNNNNNNNNAVPAQGHGNAKTPVPVFHSAEEICQWLCQKHSPNFDYGCPPSCDGGILGTWSKRAARGRRFDDFSFGFDDYLFLKLLGRDLGERA